MVLRRALRRGRHRDVAPPRLRQRQRLRLEAVRDAIARDLHDDIGSTLGSINIYSATVKRRLAKNDVAGAQEVMDRIGGSSREMIDRMHDIVWSVDSDKDAFSDLSQRMRTLAADLPGTGPLAVTVEEDPHLHGVKLDMAQRKGLYLIYKEALNNTVKHADATSVHGIWRKMAATW